MKYSFKRNKFEKKIATTLGTCVAVHYSCERFDGDSLHLPKVIQLIKFHNGEFKGSQTIKFKCENKVGEGLNKFYDYLRKNQDHYFLSWRMENERFGYPHLENVARAHNVSPYVIPEDKNINLKNFISLANPLSSSQKTGMKRLFDLNSLNTQDFLEGAVEAENCVKSLSDIEASTYCKSLNIHALAEKFSKGKLLVNSEDLKVPSVGIISSLVFAIAFIFCLKNHVSVHELVTTMAKVASIIEP